MGVIGRGGGEGKGEEMMRPMQRQKEIKREREREGMYYLIPVARCFLIIQLNCSS